MKQQPSLILLTPKYLSEEKQIMFLPRNNSSKLRSSKFQIKLSLLCLVYSSTTLLKIFSLLFSSGTYNAYYRKFFLICKLKKDHLVVPSAK